MPDFGFVGAAYQAPSIYQDAQECINWRPEVDPTKAQGDRGIVALYPTPGLSTKIVSQNQQEVRGLRTLSGGSQCMAVVGPYVYVLSSNFTPSLVGQLKTTTGRVGISDNGINVYIVDGSYRYTWRISNPSVAKFNGSISGTTLTVNNLQTGALAVGQQVFGIGVTAETVIVSGSGTSWTVNISQTVASETMNTAAAGAIITGSLGSGTLTVTAVSSGTLYVGQTIQGTSVTANTVITALGSGIVLSGSVSSGGTGYAVNDTVTVVGGTYSQPATYVVTSVSAGVVTGITQTSGGTYTSNPVSPVTTSTSGAGTGLVLALTFGTGSGGTGTYTVSGSQTVSSETLYALSFSVLPTSDGAFSGADVVDIVDNYFVYNSPSSQQFGATNALSPISPQLSFSSKDGSPDNLVSIIVDHREIYLLGETSSEVWVDVGAFPFPFQRIPGTNTQHGIVAKFSVSRIGDSFAYVSRDLRGQGTIVMMNGYTPTRISTHAVENTLVNQYIGDAIAWTYQLEGHEVYVVSFPSLDLTWAYDFATGLWHKWQWVDNYNVYHRHRGNCATQFQGIVLVGDWQNGKIYQLDPNTYTDDSQEIRRLRRTPHLTTDLQRQFFDELQIQFQPGVGLQGNQSKPNTNATAGIAIAGYAIAGGSYIAPPGVNPQAMLRWSDNGGSTWSNEHWTSIGAIGAYQNRARWRRLGWSRDRVFEVVVTDPVKAVIISANLKASAGDN